MDFEKARYNMVEQQIRPWGVLDPDVLDTLSLIKRERFVSAAHQSLALAEVALPIGFGQSMLEPMIEAKALQALAPSKTDSVLEIGAGSGYMAALLAARAEWVRSVEIVPQLAQLAHDNLAVNGIDNVIVEEGDASAGWPERGPYDAIMVSGALTQIPPALLTQLKRGGRLFAFVGQAPVMSARLITHLGEGVFVSRDLFEWWAPAIQQSSSAGPFAF